MRIRELVLHQHFNERIWTNLLLAIHSIENALRAFLNEHTEKNLAFDNTNEVYFNYFPFTRLFHSQQTYNYDSCLVPYN
jgi:hypothetical protein